MDFHLLELFIGIMLGILAGFYFAKRLKKKNAAKLEFVQQRRKKSTQKPMSNIPETMVKESDSSTNQSLNNQPKNLDLDETLNLLNQYQTDPNFNLQEELHEHLEGHDAEGNNALQAYLHQEEVDTETMEHMVEHNHHLLTEENEHGETALHVAVHHNHFEAAEWLSEAHHYHSAHEHFHVLSHHDHQGHTALHDAAHLWHHHPHSEHLFEMLGEHPEGALMWKNEAGKTVYEEFFEHPQADRQGLLQHLEHRGIIHKNGDHYEISQHVLHHIQDAHKSQPHNMHHLAHTLIREYSLQHHQHTPSTHQATPHQNPTHDNKHHQNPHSTHHPH